MTINPLMTRERVVIPPRKAPTRAEKASAWSRVNGLCERCGKPVPPEGPNVEYDHDDAREISGDDSTGNLRPLHVKCHRDKTSTEDARRIAKVHRQERLTKAKVAKRGGFRGHRKFNGEIVWK